MRLLETQFDRTKKSVFLLMKNHIACRSWGFNLVPATCAVSLAGDFIFAETLVHVVERWGVSKEDGVSPCM